MYLLMQWLQQHQLPSIPIHSYIALADPSTVVRVQGDEEMIAKRVIRAEEVTLRMLQTEKACAARDEKNPQRRNQITNKIMERIKDFSVDVMEKYNIQENEIKKGTRCTECGGFNMIYYYGRWRCQSCGTSNKNAHEVNFHDYYLLYKDDITVSEAMEFLNMDDRYKTYRLLKKSNTIYYPQSKTWILKSDITK